MAHITDSLGSNYCFPFGLFTLWIAWQVFIWWLQPWDFNCADYFPLHNLPCLPPLIHLLLFSALFGAFAISPQGSALRILAGYFQLVPLWRTPSLFSCQVLGICCTPSWLEPLLGASSSACRSMGFSDRTALSMLLWSCRWPWLPTVASPWMLLPSSFL